MKLKEIVSGTPDEISALQAGDEAKRKLAVGSKLSPKQVQSIGNADEVSRRIFLRRLGVAGLGLTAAAAIPAGYLILDGLNREPDQVFEQGYVRYIRGFEDVAKGDLETEELLSFFKQRRKQGKLENGRTVAMEAGNTSENFYTVMVDPSRDKALFRNLAGFAVYDSDTMPSTLFLKNVPLAPVFAGALLTHESHHIYQRLNGANEDGRVGFLNEEVYAYNLEFDVLDRVSGGKFRQALLDVVANFDFFDDSGKRDFVINGFNPQEYRKIDGVFERAKSEEEKQLRAAVYVVAANFVSIEGNSTSPEQEEAEKRMLIDMFFKRGGVGSLLGCTPSRCEV